MSDWENVRYLTLAISRYNDSGNFSMISAPLAILAAVFDQLGHYEQAATVSGFAATPLSRMGLPELTSTIDHLRDVLGDETYDALTRAGKTMPAAAIATYALDQIDQARAQLRGAD